MKNKNRKFLSLMLVFCASLALSACSSKGETGPQGPQGIPGENGQDGKDGTSVLTGEGVPQTNLGENGDSYINLLNWDYYVKENGTWILKDNIKGENGANGQDGKDGIDGTNGTDGKDGTSVLTGEGVPQTNLGENGDSYINLLTWDYYVKENGTWILKGNIKGEQGESGSDYERNTFTVNFYVDDDLIATREVLEGSKVSRPTEAETAGYTINDWFYLDGSVREPWFFGYVITEDTNLYAEYTCNQYTISFVDDVNDQIVSDLTVTYDENYSLPSLEQTGYIFNVWLYNNEMFANNGIYRIAGDITLYASWNANKYRVILNPDGGVLSKTYLDVIYDCSYTLPSPTKTGYSFLGWYDGEIKISSNATWKFLSNKTFIAKWSNTPMTYVFDSGDGTCGIESMVILYDSEYTLPIPTLDGYYFACWKLGDTDIPLTGTWTYSTTGGTLFAVWISCEPEINNQTNTAKFGLYPNSYVSNTNITKELDKLSPCGTNDWYYYENDFYAKRTVLPNGSATFYNGDPMFQNRTYWFKCDPIDWIIVSSNDDNYVLTTQSIVDGYYFAENTNQNRELVDTGTIIEGKVYSNNYKESILRSWLNENFYETAFPENESFIQISEVKNDVESTGLSENMFVCENTFDKVYTPSVEELNNLDISLRKCKNTEWAMGSHFMNTESDFYCSGYMTRSPKNDYTNYGYVKISMVFYNGIINYFDTGVPTPNGAMAVSGVRPMIKIAL